MKKILASILIFVFCFISSGITPVEASTIKLNKTSLTLNEGSTYSLKLSGTTKTIKWSTSNKAIATVSTKGTVKGIKAGTATITATVSSKKYNCKVTIKEIFNAKKAIQNLYIEDHGRGRGIIQIAKNNYSFPMNLEATIVYYDSSDMMIGKSSANNYYFEKGAECVLFYSAPTDSNYDYVPYDHYKVTYSATPVSRMKSNLKDIVITSNIGIDNVMLEVTNNGDQSADFTQIYILFYQNDEIIGYDYQYADVQESGSVDYLEFSFPYDDNYDTVQIDDYKIFVNSSYYYTNW